MSGFRTIVESLSSQDPDVLLSTLMDLSSSLAYQGEDPLRMFPANRAFPILAQLVGHPLPDIGILAARCLCNLVSALPMTSSLLGKAEIMTAIVAPLQTPADMDIAEQCISILDHSTQAAVSPEEEVANKNGLAEALLESRAAPALLTFLDFWPMPVQRQCFAIIARMFALCERSRLSEQLESFASVFIQSLKMNHGDDPELSKNLIVALSNCVETSSGSTSRLFGISDDPAAEDSVLLVFARIMQKSKSRTIVDSCIRIFGRLAQEFRMEPLPLVQLWIREHVFEALRNAFDVMRAGVILDILLNTFPPRDADNGIVERRMVKRGSLLEDYVREPYEQVFPILFPHVLQMYNTLKGVDLQRKCLLLLSQMIDHSSSAFLREALRPLPVSSLVSNVLRTPDLRKEALFMVKVLLDRLNDVYERCFEKEGVFFVLGSLGENVLQIAGREVAGVGDKIRNLSSISSQLSEKMMCHNGVRIDSDEDDLLESLFCEIGDEEGISVFEVEQSSIVPVLLSFVDCPNVSACVRSHRHEIIVKLSRRYPAAVSNLVSALVDSLSPELDAIRLAEADHSSNTSWNRNHMRVHLSVVSRKTKKESDAAAGPRRTPARSPDRRLYLQQRIRDLEQIKRKVDSLKTHGETESLREALAEAESLMAKLKSEPSFHESDLSGPQAPSADDASDVFDSRPAENLEEVADEEYGNEEPLEEEESLEEGDEEDVAVIPAGDGSPAVDRTTASVSVDSPKTTSPNASPKPTPFASESCSGSGSGSGSVSVSVSVSNNNLQHSAEEMIEVEEDKGIALSEPLASINQLIQYMNLSSPVVSVSFNGVAVRNTTNSVISAAFKSYPASTTAHPLSLPLWRTTHLLRVYTFEQTLPNPELGTIGREDVFLLLKILDELLDGIVSRSTFNHSRLSQSVVAACADPVLIATSGMPGALSLILDRYPFLVTFDSRRAFYESFSLGPLRGAARFARTHPHSDLYRGGLKKNKIRLDRATIVPSAVKAFKLAGSQLDAIMEFEFFNEEGTGSGPSNEFYAVLAQKLSLMNTLWYTNTSRGFFPSPSPAMGASEPTYRMVGQMIARALVDRRLVDFPVNSFVWSYVMADDPEVHITSEILDNDDRLEMIVSLIDPGLVFSLKNLVLKDFETSDEIENLCLMFVLPGYPDCELMERGSSRSVCTKADVLEYRRLVFRYLLCGSSIRSKLAWIRAGFFSVLPSFPRKLFSSEELDALLCGSRDESIWDVEALYEHVRLDHGYTASSVVIRSLFEVLCELQPEEQALFVKFLTGTPRLPIGGLRNLEPKFTVVRKVVDSGNVDDSLPSVMTCQNYLKLPEYSSKDILASKLRMAIREGQEGFSLS
eukprot:ANDGO_06627.mRNA.1 E3 ubiquitin-protein ligase UPL3